MIGRLSIAVVLAALTLAPAATAGSYPAAPWITEGADGTVRIGEPPAGHWPWDPGMGSDPQAGLRLQAI